MSYELWLRGVYLPHYDQNPNLAPQPQYAEYDNLAFEPEGWSKYIQSPDFRIASGTEYKLEDLITPSLAKYIYVPPNWNVRMQSANNESILFTKTGLMNLQEVEYSVPSSGDETIVYGNVTRVTFTQLSLNSNTHEANWDQNKESICMGAPFNIGGVPMPGLVPHTEGCDVFMANLCAQDSQINNPNCSCFVEQAELEFLYPNSITEVTCLGATCGLGGYKTNRMMEEKCSIQYCTEFIAEQGANVIEAGHTTITCAGRSWQLNPDGSVVTPPRPTQVTGREDLRYTPFYLYIVLGISLLVGGLLAYIIVKTYSK